MQRLVLGHVRYMTISIVAVSLYLLLWGIALALFGLVWWPFALFAFFPLLVLHHLSDGRRMLDPESWMKGWVGESRVKKLLKELEPSGYRIVNHLDTGHGDVDHVVIGPTGVFAIDTKNHDGGFAQRGASLTNDGWPVDDILAQVRGEAAAVRRKTAVQSVQAVVVVPTGGLANHPLFFKYVTVVDNGRLLTFITDRGHRFDPSEVDRIASLLR
jgi:hypothetical protein